VTQGLTALGIACLIVWGGLWLYLFSLQRRLDALEDRERSIEE
jgi:CcmD family protein